MIKIRILRKEDIPCVTRIMKKFPNEYPDCYINSNKRGSIRWLLKYLLSTKDKLDSKGYVLEIDKKAIGHVAYYKDVRSFEGRVYELRALVVDKNFQGKGYGEKLIRHSENDLKKIKARVIWLQTGKEGIQYYNKLGYKTLAIFQNYWGFKKNRYIMEKKIK